MQHDTWQPGSRLAFSESQETGNSPFRAFLEQHRLSLLDVAQAAGVRLMTFWNIQTGRPVRSRDAQAVRTALFRLTGLPYYGPLAEKPADE
jgi:hypothetical protein